MKRVVIVGGGVGGTIVANLLARKLKHEIDSGAAKVSVVDDPDPHLSSVHPAAQLPCQEIRSERAADAAAKDQDPLHHGPQWVFSTTISS